MQDFERYNGDIARYVEQREILAPLSMPRLDECSKYCHIVRDNACEVYHALEDGWRCRCSNSHNANLQLECRKPAQASPLFNISLSFFSESSQCTTAQRNWLKAQVNVDEPDEQIDTNSRRQGNDMTRSVDNSGFPDALGTSSNTADTFSPVMASNSNTARRIVRIMEPHGDLILPLQQQGKTNTVFGCRRYVLTNSRAKIEHQAQSACSPNYLSVRGSSSSTKSAYCCWLPSLHFTQAAYKNLNIEPVQRRRACFPRIPSFCQQQSSSKPTPQHRRNPCPCRPTTAQISVAKRILEQERHLLFLPWT